MGCTAKCCIADGEKCRDYYICDKPKYATIEVYETTVEKCKNQPMSWLEVGITLAMLLVIAIALIVSPRLGM